ALEHDMHALEREIDATGVKRLDESEPFGERTWAWNDRCRHRNKNYARPTLTLPHLRGREWRGNAACTSMRNRSVKRFSLEIRRVRAAGASGGLGFAREHFEQRPDAIAQVAALDDHVDSAVREE